MHALDLASLDCLAALADAGSFEKAAQVLSITQSAVSQRLRGLEMQIGQPLVIRSRPLQLTDAGKLLLRFARQMQALRADAARELGALRRREERIPIAVNADSLATWVLPALDDLVHQGLQEGFGVELVVDDQDFTLEWLRQGEVLGCVSTLAQPMRGGLCEPLGLMRYVAVASPAFMQRVLPGGLTRATFARAPYIAFNRKDDMQVQWVEKAFDIQGPRLQERHVPSSEAGLRAACMGWGIAVLPALLARPALEVGDLVCLVRSTWRCSGTSGNRSATSMRSRRPADSPNS